MTPERFRTIPWVVVEKLLRKEKHLQINHSPSQAWFSIIKLVHLISPNKEKYGNLVRYISATRVRNDPLSEEITMPSIEVLLMAKASDFEILELAVNSVIEQSVNRVNSVIVVVPEKDLTLFEEKFSKTKAPLKIISENALVEENLRHTIFKFRRDRYGWILQQVIAAKWLLTTESKYTLLLDVDTVLLRKKVWVNSHGKQLLMPTFEYNPEYYKFFEHKSDLYKQKKRSFVSHHLLVDTAIFREIFQAFWSLNLERALNEAIEFSSEFEYSPFDLKFEIYSYYLLAKYPERVAFCKWANSAAPRDLVSAADYQALKLKYGPQYNSISFHHYTK